MSGHRIIEPAFAVVAWACAATSSALAMDVLVPQEVATIQAGIDLAQPGDRVLVSPGIYAERIDFRGKDIVIESVGGPETTIIDGQGGVGYVVTAAGGEAQAGLVGFTITGGVGEAGSFGGGPGGGMVIDGAAAVIENCHFIANTGVFGGGLSIVDGAAIVRGSRFENNQALHGGGLYIEVGELTVEDSAFDGNSATNFGGAMAIFWLSDAVVRDSGFTGNESDSFGGAIYTNHAAIEFSRLDVIGNGKAEELPHGAWSIGTFGGGGIYTDSTHGRIDASRIRGNVAAAGSGLYIAGSGTIEVTNSLIAENGLLCNCGQGAVYANSSNPVIINSTIVNNGGFFGVFTTYNAFPTVRNTIIAGQKNDLGSQSPIAGNGLTDASFSLFEGEPYRAVLGEGVIIIETSPLLDPDADFTPLEGSLAIDAGDNASVPADLTTDLLGNARVDNGRVDIGAIETRSPGSQVKQKDLQHHEGFQKRRR